MPDALNGVPAIAAQIPLKEATDPQHLSNILWTSANLKDGAPEVLSIVPAMAVQIRLESKGLEPPMFGHKFVAKKTQVIQCDEMSSTKKRWVNWNYVWGFLRSNGNN